MSLYLLPLFFALGACSFQKIAIRSSTPMVESSPDLIMKERSWEFFRQSAPANIKFVEILWQQDRDNLRLLSTLIKSYAGYAFAVPETLSFEAEVLGEESAPAKREAIEYYTRALDYGVLYFSQKGITSKDLLSLEELEMKKKLEGLGEDDISAMLYTAQSWGSLINLQKDNIALVTQVPRVKLLFDRVCELKPDIDRNVCDIFYAQYDSARPKMLGGDPEKGEKRFLEAIRKAPENLLIRMNYIQFVIVPAMDADKYNEQEKILSEEFAKWDNLNRDSLENVSPYRKHEDLNLYNAIAKKRFLIVQQNKKKIF